jgi:antitoxin (DNA-binding transcriptional repressor) of toxin-antitoxin stability system
VSKPALKVPTTEFSRHFGDYLSRVRFGGETIVVLKNNLAVAELRALPGDACTLGALLDLLNHRTADPEFAADIEQVNRADRPMENPWG